MESTKDGDLDEAKQQTEEPGGAPAGHQANAGGDLFSGLCDDVLVHILGLAEHARDVVRTGALSRRWRGLWRRVPALRFTSGPWFERGGSAQGFIAFVDDTLALRAARSGDGGGLEQLKICLLLWYDAFRHRRRLVPPSTGGAAERWIHYAVRHGLRSLHLELYLPDDDDSDEDHDGRSEAEAAPPAMISLAELPSSSKLEAMYLDLGFAGVRLPAAVAFASLSDLTLETFEVAGDHVANLARLVSSSCCPSLRKLAMSYVTLHEQQSILVEAAVLTELSLDDVHGMRSLELRTPSLRVLCIKYCHDLESLVASVPRLEKLTCRRNRLLIIDRDFPYVSDLKLDLNSHRHPYGPDDNHGSINLLRRSSSTSCLHLDLHVSKERLYDVDIIKGRIPQLGHVRSLKIRVFPTWNRIRLHSVGDCVASLLTAFNNIRYLHLHLGSRIREQQQSLCTGSVCMPDCTCDHWKSNKISFIHLVEAEFSGVTGTDCELRFLQSILSGATQLQKAVLGFIQKKYSLKSRCNDFRHMLLGTGTWTECHNSYEWRWSQ